MSDRLREAADRLDDIAAALRGLPWTPLGAVAILAAQAEQLRAVAEEYPCRCYISFARCRVHNIAVEGHRIVVAALALADVILGGTDE